MKITITGRKCSPRDSFKDHAEKKLAKIERFFGPDLEATVTVTVEKKWQTVEIAIKDRKLQFRSEQSADSMEIALEDAVDNLEGQIIKNKERIHRKFNGYAYFDDLVGVADDMDDYEVVRKKVFALQPQSVDDAILEMNMLGHTFFMFKDIVTEEINVVYKRKDGNYGLLIPE